MPQPPLPTSVRSLILEMSNFNGQTQVKAPKVVPTVDASHSADAPPEPGEPDVKSETRLKINEVPEALHIHCELYVQTVCIYSK